MIDVETFPDSNPNLSKLLVELNSFLIVSGVLVVESVKVEVISYSSLAEVFCIFKSLPSFVKCKEISLLISTFSPLEFTASLKAEVILFILESADSSFLKYLFHLKLLKSL